MLSDCFLGLETAVSHQWLDELGEAERRDIAKAYDTVPAAGFGPISVKNQGF